MNPFPQNHIPEPVLKAEETLRMIACAPAPHGLVDRVQANLTLAPRPSWATSWRTSFTGWMYSPALRGFAAAAIVCVVAGGGWSIYMHVQPAPTARVIETPARVGGSGAFSNAGAMRKPDTLNGPVLAKPVAPEKQTAGSAAGPATPARKGTKASTRHKKAANPSQPNPPVK